MEKFNTGPTSLYCRKSSWKREANVLIATLQNWSMVEKQLVESINASGSAMQENEIYMQSWEAKTKQLSANMLCFGLIL